MSIPGGTGEGGVSRRRLLFIGGAGVLGAAFAKLLEPVFGGNDKPEQQALDPHTGHEPTATPSDAATGPATVRGTVLTRWSDPKTWNGKIPGPGDIANIDSPVLLDVDASVGGVVVGPAGQLIFDPAHSRTLTSKGNVIVRGKLQMRPKSAAVIQTINITGSKESVFKGGGAIPLSTDTGLWVTGNGIFDAVGAARRGWVRASGSIAKGARSVTLAGTPTGWRAGDEVVITPTRSPASSDKHYAEYDVATITGVSGRTIKLSKATSYPHPVTNVGGGKKFAAEVLNLTRNVRVEGKPGARIHVFMNSGRKQALKYFALRYVGPRQGTQGVLGRYGLHFHMVGNASRGSLVEGAVVRQAGHHGFVNHASHGVTFRDCVAHDTMSQAFWWDPGEGNATRDGLWDRCLSSLVHTDGNEFRLSGFWLGHGEGNRAIGCVAVGVQGSKNASGFQWPESPGPREDGTVWGFKDCVAHNNKVNGIFVWQNNAGKSVIDRFVAYHNGKAGIEHGAYKNVYQYKNSTLYANGLAGALVWAVSGNVVPLSFVNVVFDGAGRNDYSILTQRHTAPPNRPTKVTGCTFKGYKKAAFGLLDNSQKNPDTVDVVDCTFAANEFWLANDIDPDTLVRVQDAKLGTIALRRSDQPGTYHPEWNARVTSIPTFA
ncbi:MAG: hypothetical protein ACRDKS_05725 [Actinomycetota bacterium]